jgi:hypothetical protein
VRFQRNTASAGTLSSPGTTRDRQRTNASQRVQPSIEARSPAAGILPKGIGDRNPSDCATKPDLLALICRQHFAHLLGSRNTSAGCCVISAKGLMLNMNPAGVRSAQSLALRSAGSA